MSLTINNTAVKKITLNGDDVKHLDYNGTRTWDAYRTMTVYIDESVADPELACTYGDDAIGMTPGSDAWDEFFGHYPCMLLNGVEGQKLQRNDFTKHEDGTAADITSGDEGDVMICFPRRGLIISKTGDVVKITMTDDPNTITEYRAHTTLYDGREMVDKFYIGAYLGTSSYYNEKIPSLSGKPVYKSTMKESAMKAKREGFGYRYYLLGFAQLTYIQAMYVLKYKNLNSRSVIGHGYSNSDTVLNTGGTETRGMDWGKITEDDHMKLFGIEDLWGNRGQWISKVLMHRGFSGSSDVYYVLDGKEIQTPNITLYTSDISGWISCVLGTSMGGFVRRPRYQVSGSATTYYCDLAATTCPPEAGKYCYASLGESGGIFNLLIAYSYSTEFNPGNIPTRLMYV